MLTSRSLVAAGCLLLPLAVGCGQKDTPQGEEDMAQPPAADLSKPPADDLRAPADMTQPPDMTNPTEKPKLTGVPLCTGPILTAAQLYEKSFKPSCSNNGNCHRAATSGDALKAWWVNQTSMQTTAVKIVTPGDLDQSYLMYKLLGQHMNPLVGGKGDAMPKNGMKLPDEQLCNFISWIKGGAG